MTTDEERMRILKMVEEGQISAEEAARLLAALDKASGVETKSAASSESLRRFFRVRVTDSATGQQKVNVNIPAGLVDIGLRFAPDSVKQHLHTIRAAINSGMTGRIVDVVDDHGGRVEIFIE